MRRERLHVRFESPEALRSEFDKNIANGGLFVATEEPYEVRQPVTVEMELAYLRGAGGADCPGGVVELDGEIVHRVPVEMASSGMQPGVALQLDEAVPELRERFTALLGKRVEDPDADRDGPARRSARRNAIRVPVRVMPSLSPPFEATSRDLSHSGVLLSIGDQALPVGEVVRVCLWHPSGEPCVVVDGKVVREVRNKSGRTAAVAIAFDRTQAADERVRDVVDALRQTGHRNQLGGISGSLGDLGLANLLQMFGSSAPQGTLVVESDGEQGWIAFAEGQLLGAEVGSLNGREALLSMLAWEEGRFHFEAKADETLVASAERRPLQGAVLDALCTLDERAQQIEPGAADAGETLVFDGEGPLESDAEGPLESDGEGPIESAWPEAAGDAAPAGSMGGVAGIGPETRFDVDAEQEELSIGSLDKVEEALIDLARSGLSRARMVEVIPESPETVQSALEGLVDLGVLRPR